MATRHPWSCLLFVAPLLAVYEFGLHLLGPPPDELRNGADAWLRLVLQNLGIPPSFGAPALLLGLLLVWCFTSAEAGPHDYLGVWLRMTIESAGYACLLFGLSCVLFPLLVSWGGMLDAPRAPFVQVPGASNPGEAWQLIVRYVGAGIYEETLFRLLLFSGLVFLFHQAELQDGWGLTLATILSALLFAGAHHLGPNGEPFHLAVFLFRTFAGLYFAILYHFRGFGIVVGAHAGYDVLVGLLLRFLG